jgi:hypothetical protein
MNWIKKPEPVVFCNICNKDLTKRDKIYWTDLVYCSTCYKRQTFNGFGEDLK